MNCPKCGAPLPNGAGFCVRCGTPVQQPGMQPQTSGIQIQQPGSAYYQTPQEQALPGGVVANPTMISVPQYVKPSVCRIVGAVLILISAIVPIWFGSSAMGGYAGVGFFTSGGGILGLWGALMLLTGLALLFFELDITAIRIYQNKFHVLPHARFYLPGFALLLLILGTFAHSLGTHNIGWGWWLCLIGILLSCVSPVMDIVKGKR